MVTENRLIQIVKDMTQLLETTEYAPLKTAMRMSPEFLSAGQELLTAFEQNRNQRNALNSQKQMATREKNRKIRMLNALRTEFADLMRRRYPKDPLLVSLNLNTKYRTVVRDGVEVQEPWRSKSESAVRNETQLLLENIETLSAEVREVMARSGWSDLEHDDLRQAFADFEGACTFMKQRVADYNLAVRAGKALFKELRDWYGLVRNRLDKILLHHKHLAGLANEAIPTLNGGRYTTGDDQAPAQSTGQPPEAREPDGDAQNPDGSTNQPPSGDNQNGGDASSDPLNNGREDGGNTAADETPGGRPPQIEPAGGSDAEGRPMGSVPNRDRGAADRDLPGAFAEGNRPHPDTNKAQDASDPNKGRDVA